MDAETRRTVRQRSDNRCEYCQLRQEHAPLWRHQIEHIIPRKHHGTDDLENLAWTCIRCNLSKSSNLSGIDDETGQIIPLFDPRKQGWREHFAFQQAEIIGLTPTGRATVAVLNMNEPRRLQLRQELLDIGELD
jgi:5-methylcytosine-specific restriction endonuclease McrA